MNAFADALHARFADPNLGRDATYTSAATGLPVAVRVLVACPGMDVGVFGQRIATDSLHLRVLSSAVAEPTDGDVVTLDGADYVVQGRPKADDRRLSWTLDTRPA